jgi:hypothetical protein
MKNNIKNTDQIKVHVINVGYDVKGTDVIAHLVWYPVYPREYDNIAPLWFRDMFRGEKRKSVGVAHLKDGDKFDLRKGQRIALAKAETIAYGEVVRDVKDTLAGLEKGISQAQDFLAKATRVKEGNVKYIQRVDSGEIK